MRMLVTNASMQAGGISHESAALLLAEAMREGIREALAEQDTLIGYAELARRLSLKEKLVRQLKNAGSVYPALWICARISTIRLRSGAGRCAHWRPICSRSACN